MAMDLIMRKQFKNAVERVLHLQGNYTGGILEMAVVIDTNLPKETAIERAAELAELLKTQGEVFRNVRLNTILWQKEEEFTKQVTPLAMLRMGRFFEDYACMETPKSWDGLLALLKKFYARSKLILVLSDTDFQVKNKGTAKESLQPFLHRKLILMSGEAICHGTEILRSLVE